MPRWVVVTGGSGALGRAIVRKFVQNGDRVCFTFLRSADAACSLEQETGAVGIQADLTSVANVQALAGRIAELTDCVDVLVNNAGVTQVMPFALIEEEDWDTVIEGNLKSMFLVTQALARTMVAARRGTIINVGSIAGSRLLDVPVHYATAKAAVRGFTLALAREFSRYNIRVNSIVPGMLAEGVSSMVPEKQKEEYLRYCAAGRPGEMDEAASVVFFLAGEDASYINAQEIFVDGGL